MDTTDEWPNPSKDLEQFRVGAREIPPRRGSEARPPAKPLERYIECLRRGADRRGRHDDLNQSGGDVIHQA